MPFCRMNLRRFTASKVGDNSGQCAQARGVSQVVEPEVLSFFSGVFLRRPRGEREGGSASGTRREGPFIWIVMQ